jgi:four helix bundle protein
MQDFRKLKVWQKGHALTLAVYKASKSYPKEELFGLTSQLRRATASMPTNIAEGCGRGSDPDFARFLRIATGSASEVEYHLLLSLDLGYLQQEGYQPLHENACEIKRMLASLIRTTSSKPQAPGTAFDS